MGWSSLKDKVGALDEGSKTGLAEFAKFRRSSISNMNLYLNELSGAAITVQEGVRLRQALPDPGTGLFDGDSPTVFKAKLDDAVKQGKLALVRYHYATARGLDPLASGIDLADVPALIERRGAELEAAARAADPALDEATLRLVVRDRLAREFGLE